LPNALLLPDPSKIACALADDGLFAAVRLARTLPDR
jgi:hypothetical protein